ncbi:MAG TPA: GNAT family N-acetyltransferase [Methanocorpusculum sp.]|nr:GNAT family N-acetyltransferase [Methanocorpusculum sp.]HJK81068.1 GNAT family N-acetyltransferase [Methanocorpusculum sp.]
MLITDRLTILPLTTDQFDLLLRDKKSLERSLGLRPSGIPLDTHTHEAMSGLFREAKSHPENYFWYTYWIIILRADAVAVGGLCFMQEPDAAGESEIGYGIDPPFQNCGYMTEALSAVCSWAKGRTDVRTITAETETTNTASRRVLEKNGFSLSNRDGDQTYWRIAL